LFLSVLIFFGEKSFELIYLVGLRFKLFL
jgi:hypothetical protein